MENNNQPPQIESTPVQTPPAANSSKKMILGIIIFIVLAAAGVASYYFFIWQPQAQVENIFVMEPKKGVDEALLDDSDLRLQKVSVPDADNAFFDLFQLNDCTSHNPLDCKSIISLPEGFNEMAYTNYSQPVEWNQKLVDEVLQKNQQALELLDRAVSKKYFQIPDYADPALVNEESRLYAMHAWGLVSRLQALRALSLSWQGKPDEALLEAVKLNKLAHIMINSNALKIQILSAVSIQNLGSNTILQVLPYGKPTKQTLQQVLATLLDNDDNVTGFQNGFRMQYISTINTMDKFSEHPDQFIAAMLHDEKPETEMTNLVTEHPHTFMPNQTKNLLQFLYRTQLEAVGESCGVSSEDSILFSKLYFNPDDPDPAKTDNWIGKNFVSLEMLGSPGANIPCQNDLLNKVAEVQVALKNYQMEKGALPLQLSDLVPAYLSEVPSDPFDHKPLRYNPAKKIIYSVGGDLKDEGGSEGPDPLNVPDPTFKISF